MFECRKLTGAKIPHEGNEHPHEGNEQGLPRVSPREMSSPTGEMSRDNLVYSLGMICHTKDTPTGELFRVNSDNQLKRMG